jgi:AAA+ superfamily predicted ATPase
MDQRQFGNFLVSPATETRGSSFDDVRPNEPNPMFEILLSIGWLLAGMGVGIGCYLWFKRDKPGVKGEASEFAYQVIGDHFAPTSTKQLTIVERIFPERARADLQRAIDRLLVDPITVVRFSGLRSNFEFEGLSISDCMARNHHNPAELSPPRMLEIEIGEAVPSHCLSNGLWLLRVEGHPAVALLGNGMVGRNTLRFQLATLPTAEAKRFAENAFKVIEETIRKGESYRGKILSLETNDSSYGGTIAEIKVHKLRKVTRDELVLPESTVEQLERNIIRFVEQRDEIARYGLSTKKGLLFYGPPGTGKTHTIHYLAAALPKHTTLLITGEQIGKLSDYMELARLLQPSIVVIEDVDLIGTDRSQSSVCEQTVLNNLLNEMDGLKEDAEILFLLTTNRPQALESALAARPGRVDQAIEFPLPDAKGREKLIRLYAKRLAIDEPLMAELVRRTEQVSAAFIKELTRRMLQFHLERGGEGTLSHDDVDRALGEMLVRGGRLNLKLLGFGAAESQANEA